ncbi:CHAT domain-containing protein [Leptospira levettii]|uniref:CHAT domain-containing protein n=1 Tax=Leptospira levettii TaxID=2023178 RepID=UPI000C29F99C|nr:CHAT domain-containing protein [Leptospira levettii]MCW7471939.1 CHAT domain-containing protein [Leptospira levettii]PJZ36076.1 CHAT domain-containing protein [Leptospira levettii]PJZ87339.1 CHAT domain-containing protein [Leptospira levettii]PJZ99949.1 CHAT domain-containing protein [Leptospira levettii]
MKIRIISKYSDQGISDGECFWEEKQSQFGTVEKTTPFSGQLLKEFQNDWSIFVERILSQNPKKEEFLDKLGKKSDSLEQIVFGESLPFWRTPGFRGTIELLVDPEFSPIPWEILRSSNGFLFQDKNFKRGIRIQKNQREISKKSNVALIICNPVIPSLENTVNEECVSLYPIIEKKLPLRILKQNHLTKIRFIEELNSVKYLHYAGHTEKNGIPIGKNQFISMNVIASRSFTHLDLVFFNSCYSSFDSINQAGITTSFLKAGAKQVIGFLYPVETNLAKEIGISFWKYFLESKNAEKSLEKIRKQLQKGSGKEIITAISLVQFSTLSPNPLPKRILSITYSLLLVLCFLLFTRETQVEIPIGTQVQTEQTNGSSITENSLLSQQKSQSKDPLVLKIQKITHPEFRKKALLFLETKHELLDETQKREILESILSEGSSEEKMYYEFKTRSGF